MQRSANNPDGSKRVHAINAASDAKKELYAASEQARILAMTKKVDDVAKYLADRFNGMRAELGEFVSLMRAGKDLSEAFVASAKAISCGDYGMLLDEAKEPVGTFDVEDAGIFAIKLRQAAALVKFENRLKACCDINELIAKAISGWESKIAKMKDRTQLNGATASEVTIAEKKIVQFGEAITTLRKRGSEVAALYYDTKRKVLGIVAEADKRFKPINFNEPAVKTVNLDPGWDPRLFSGDKPKKGKK